MATVVDDEIAEAGQAVLEAVNELLRRWDDIEASNRDVLAAIPAVSEAVEELDRVSAEAVDPSGV